MSYDSYAIRYRPTQLEHLVGQENAIGIIKGMLETGSVSRSNLISGPWGAGKTTLARMFAMYLNCQGQDRKATDPPCTKCPGCRDVKTGGGRDYLEINAADCRGIDDIRSIRDAAQYKPSGKYRIFVLDEAHQLTDAAKQAFLKILEEPPQSTIFLICTTEKWKLPPTITSRCQNLAITKVSSHHTQQVLQRVVDEENLDSTVFCNDVLSVIASGADGHPRDALKILENMVNQIKGGKKFTVEEAIEAVSEISDLVVGPSAEKAAIEFLLGMYEGKATAAIVQIKAIEAQENLHQDFVNKIMEHHLHSMYWRMSKKLLDKMWTPWYDALDKKFPDKKPTVQAFVGAMDLFSETLATLRRHEGEGLYPLILMAVKSALLFKPEESLKS